MGEISKVVLTRDIHSKLKENGYKFLLITDVSVICPVNRIYSMTVKPNKAIPACQYYSCTGIDDTMVTAYMDKPSESAIFVELAE